MKKEKDFAKLQLVTYNLLKNMWVPLLENFFTLFLSQKKYFAKKDANFQ